jgi:lysophospholipase L1-like esterase
MWSNRDLILLLFTVSCSIITAQDILPIEAIKVQPSVCIKEAEECMHHFDQVVVKDVMPLLFKGTQEDIIDDPEATLAPIMRRIALHRDVVRIVHIGDSHVRGHIFPYTVRRLLESTFGEQAVVPELVDYYTNGICTETGDNGIAYSILGINGATCSKFITSDMMNKVVRLHPDLVIISFGTNEAHDRRYKAAYHKIEMNNLTQLLKKSLPKVVFLMTTPPGSYIRYKRWRKHPNTRTEKVAEAIVEFSKEKRYAYWDMYRIVGGKNKACKNWRENDFMVRDKIHFTSTGYRIQGELLYEALIKAYNQYVTN